MTRVKHFAVIVVVLAGGTLCRADSFAYIERWATGTLTTGEPFESWRIHVVVPDGDDWVGSGIDGWLTGGPTWYYDPVAGVIARPDLFEAYPDAEFGTYFTTPQLYPNSELWGNLSMSADGVFGPTFLHLGAWGGALVGSGDYVVFQGTVLNPIPDIYGSIEFLYDTLLEPAHWYTFVIPDKCECPNPSASGKYCTGDIYPNNGDGVWDCHDDGDCKVDLNDLAQLLGNYACTAGCTHEDGDVWPENGDGVIDLRDLAELLGQYGDNCN